ncbi:MAG: YbjQ family protein [bacterium]
MTLDRDALCSGTRPEITDYRVLMTGSDGFDGYEILEYKGMVWGISVRAKDMGQDCAMGCKQMVGGELSSYSQLGDESRQRAIERMLQMAQRMNANGIINVTYQLTDANQGASQVVVNGTAVYIRPILNYVPSGAMGNILAEIHDQLEQRNNR